MTVINLGTDINIQADGAGDNALVISRELTIKGGTLTSRRAGIILGADVTFENTTLCFSKLVRNGIFANGNTLTLNGVKNDSTAATSIYLFCGGVTGYTGSNKIPQPGDAGRIIIRGDNALGDVFLGSFSDDAEQNEFSGAATVTIENDASGLIGNIYAHGANESRGEGSGDLVYPDPEKYIVTGAANINLNKRITVTINGDTGSLTDAIFSYNGDSSLLEPTITNISKLNIISGELAPKVGSSFSGENVEISISEGSRLNISNYNNSLKIRSLIGGGELILSQLQTLTISEEITGTTSIGIGGIFGGASTKAPIQGRAYIKAISADPANYSFTLVPYNSLAPEVLEKDSNGNWAVSLGEFEPIILTNISIPLTKEVLEGSTSAEIPLTVTYETENEANALCYIPILVSINDKVLTIDGDAYTGYTYLPMDGIELEK